MPIPLVHRVADCIWLHVKCDVMVKP